MTPSIHERLVQWFLTGEVGLSSKFMVAVLSGVGVKPSRAVPVDLYDMVRCVKLVGLIPEWRGRLVELLAVDTAWKTAVENWTELEAVVEQYERIGGAAGRSQETDHLYFRVHKILHGSREVKEEVM